MLSPYTVLDLTDEKGELASMVLGDLGADVIKVEPPSGSPSRAMGPFLDDAPEMERSLQNFAFNRNKRGISLDLEAEAGRKTLFSLVGKADFIVESARPGEMAGRGLGFEAMRQANSRIVYVAITPFGQDGPHADFPASDLTLAAMGGPMSLQGHPDRPPVRLSLPQAWLHASVEAAVGALTAHALMLRTGQAPICRRFGPDGHDLDHAARDGRSCGPGPGFQPGWQHRPAGNHQRAVGPRVRRRPRGGIPHRRSAG